MIAGWETGRTIRAGRQKSRGGDAVHTWWFKERWEETLEGRSWSIFFRKGAWILSGKMVTWYSLHIRKIRLGSEWRRIHGKQRGQIGDCCVVQKGGDDSLKKKGTLALTCDNGIWLAPTWRLGRERRGQVSFIKRPCPFLQTPSRTIYQV